VKRVLFVSPAIPRSTGSGLQMRARMFLEGLAREHAVTLVVGSPGFPEARTCDLAELDGLVEKTVVLDFRSDRDPHLFVRRLAARLGISAGPAWDWAAPTPTMRGRLTALADHSFSLVHVFRLYMLPMALSVVGRNSTARMQLDLDDWESETRLDLSRLATGREPGSAHQYQSEASALAKWEQEWLPRMSRVLVCSEADATGLTARHGLHDVRVVPNAVQVPPALPPPCTWAVPELLFVGGLGYLPNRDAVTFLIDEVLPGLVSADGTTAARLVVAGNGAPWSLRSRLTRPGVRWVHAPERIEPLYSRAQAALAPIRAGGGTRLKALEAFAQGRPLVATAAAVAGLGVTPGTHYLRAETAAEWVTAIRALLACPALRARLTASGFDWVRGNCFAGRVAEIQALARSDS